MNGGELVLLIGRFKSLNMQHRHCLRHGDTTCDIN